ncbi:MAG: hypothetical protein ABIY71_05375 [Flavobacteriales bacterium]
MKPLFTQSVLAAALLVFSLSPRTPLANGPQVLILDGKVRTKDIAFEDVRLVVERNGIPVDVVTKDLRHFQLQLDLQQDYVLTFHKESCLSKSLHIDTHVPEQALEASPYSFPFLVTLQPRPKGPVIRYAAPVGEINFREDKGDFGYATDYSLARERKRDDSSHEPTTVVRIDSTSITAKPPSSLAGPTTLSPVSMEHSPTADSKAFSQNNAASLAAVRATEPRRAASVQDVPYGSIPDGRTDEVQVRPTYVAREIRITKQGSTHVFRKVTPLYGDARYFCNGSSCSEATFVTATQH